MKYQQLHVEERSSLATLKRLGMSVAEMARELRRNAAPHDGWYRAGRAHERAVARRGRSRRNSQFGKAELARVEALLREEWSPAPVAGYLRRRGEFLISHETIYRHVWRDLKKGGSLHLHLRCTQKQCRKRYGRHDSRGRLAGKRSIAERPAAVEGWRQLGHWEIDTVLGQSLGESSDCLLTLVERRSGYVLIGKLRARTVEQARKATLALMRRYLGSSGRSPPTTGRSSTATRRSKRPAG